MIKKVIKRDGAIVDFDEDKIIISISKALDAVGMRQPTNYIYGILEAKYLVWHKKTKISVETLQDYIEDTLMSEGLHEVARAYIKYRYQRQVARDAKTSINKAVTDYIEQDSWRVKENSNITYSYSSLQNHLAGTIIANYTLNQLYPENIRQAHLTGDFHIHDLSMGTAGYCAGWDLYTLLYEGFGGVPGKISSRPPSRLNSAVDQMVNYIGVLQNEFSGAQAFSSFDTLLAPYIRKDNMTFQEVKQCMENFIYGVNVTSRWGQQSPFSNISLDWKVPSDLKDRPVLIQGKDQGTTYGDYQAEIEVINKAFLSVMLDGDADNLPFTFPVLTIGITKDFDYTTENADLLFQLSAKYGTPNFSNYVNSGLDPSDVRSMCCRLSLSIEDLRKHTGGLFGAGVNTGSVGVCTINLPRIGYLSKSKLDFKLQLDKLLRLAKESLLLKRKIVDQNLERGLFPYTKRYLGNFKKHFCTIGFVGGHECCMNFLGKGIETPEGKEFMEDVLYFMRSKIEGYTRTTGILFNLEATPSEGTSFRLAQIDKATFPEIYTSGEDVAYYTNSCHPPVGWTDDIFKALDHQDSLQTIMTGGTVVHIFTGEKLEARGVAALVKKVVDNYKLPYFSITPTFSLCPDHKYFAGEHDKCPTCGKDCSIYSRIVGYMRAVKDWNRGKREEFKDRKPYKI